MSMGARWCTVALCVLLAPGVPARAAMEKIAVTRTSGTVEVMEGGSEPFLNIVGRRTLRPDDAVRTGSDGHARLEVTDAEVRLVPDSLAVVGYTSVRLKVGTTWVRMRRSGRGFQLLGPGASLLVRGTLFRTEARGEALSVQLLEGSLEILTSAGVRPLAAGQSARIADGKPVIRRMDARTRARLTAEFSRLLLREGRGGTGGTAPGASPAGGGGGRVPRTAPEEAPAETGSTGSLGTRARAAAATAIQDLLSRRGLSTGERIVDRAAGLLDALAPQPSTRSGPGDAQEPGPAASGDPDEVESEADDDRRRRRKPRKEKRKDKRKEKRESRDDHDEDDHHGKKRHEHDRDEKRGSSGRDRDDD